MKKPLSSSSFLKQHPRWSSGDLRIPCLFFLAALLLAVPLSFFSDVPERDVAVRYASMAEEFAAGNWAYAFHPRVPIFHSTVCGILVRLFGISGFTAAKIISVISYSLAVFPLYAVMKRVFDTRIAAGALFIYVVNPLMIRSSFGGLRESTKCLLLIMMVHAILLIREKTHSGTGFLYLSASAGLAMITRSEMILFCGLVLWGAMIWETLARQDMRRNFDGAAPESNSTRAKPSALPLYSFAGTFLTDAIVFIPAVVNYAVFGFPTPETRYLVIFETIFGRMPSLPDAVLIAVFVPFAMMAPAMLLARGIPRKYHKPVLLVFAGVFIAGYLAMFFREAFIEEWDNVKDFLLLIGDTFNLFWSLPALICLAVRFRSGTFSSLEKLLLAFIVMHTLVITGQNMAYEHTLAFSARYLHPVSPLGFGWTFYGFMLLAGFICRFVLRQHLPVRTAMIALLGVYTFYGLLRGIEPVLRDHFKPKDVAVRHGTFRLAEIFRANRPAHSRAAAPPLDLISYEGSAVPGVYFERTSKYCVSAYLAGGRVVQNMEQADFYVTVPRQPEEKPAPPPGEGWLPLEEKVPMGVNRESVVYFRKEAEL